MRARASGSPLLEIACCADKYLEGNVGSFDRPGIGLVRGLPAEHWFPVLRGEHVLSTHAERRQCFAVAAAAHVAEQTRPSFTQRRRVASR